MSLSMNRYSSVIDVRNLKKKYRKAKDYAVDDVSFQVRPGQFFALLGPNGAGKTTTVSILTTTLSPTDGQVWVAGYDVMKEASAVRRSLGVIFQQPSLDLNLTAEENVRFHAILYGLYRYRPTFSTMPREYRRQIHELSGVLGIEKDIFKPVRTFSGGMKRKLEIVRSLIHWPKVLFLDEPTTGLDAASRRSLWSYLQHEQRQNKTTFFLTTHYMEEAEEADTICILDRGKVVSYGSPSQVKADLVQEYLIVDTQDHEALKSELRQKGIAFSGAAPFRIELNGRTVHQMLKDIDTPLSAVEIHSPTLEDAYLQILER